MLMVFESEGKDVTEANWQEILKNKNQGAFFPGISVMETTLDPGKYTIVLSPEDTRQNGAYEVMVKRIRTEKHP